MFSGFLSIIFFEFFNVSSQGSEQIHYSKYHKDPKNSVFMKFLHEDARTLYETFRRGSYESNNGPCLGWRDDQTSKFQVFQK